MRKKSRAHTNNTRKEKKIPYLILQSCLEATVTQSSDTKKSFVVENAAAKEKAKRNKLNQQNVRKEEEGEIKKVALIKKKKITKTKLSFSKKGHH